MRRKRAVVISVAFSFSIVLIASVALWNRSQSVPSPPPALPSGEVNAIPGSRAFVATLPVELSAPEEVGEIRYTLDGSEPTVASTLYDAPIVVSRSLRLSARTFLRGEATSPILRHSYVHVDENVLAFRSEIPVIVIETLGNEIQRYRDHSGEGTPYVDSIVHVFDTVADGHTSFAGEPSYSGRAGVKARGSSTLGREKASLTLEIRDALGEDLDVALLGLPAESDWVLLGPFQYDRALIRNALIYELSRQTGRYAPRTRFVEIFLNEDGGAVNGPVPHDGDYYGVYVLIEKIKRGSDRVAVDKLLPEDNTEPTVTGGYILKVDRAGPGDVGFYSGDSEFHYVYPKERSISSTQSAWIEGYLDAFHTALASRDFSENGYERYLDVDSVIDYHIMNEFTKNPDGYIYSAYFHKPRGGKLVAGPVWDFDRTMGCDNDRRAYNPRGWSRVAFRFWYRHLFRDGLFRERYADRWAELREGPLSYDNVADVMDSMADSIEHAAERNTARWGDWVGLRPGEWRREIGQLKTWVRRRFEWMDQAIRAP